MSAPGTDVNYAYAVGRIRALESTLLPDAQLARLADAPDVAAALDGLREFPRYAAMGAGVDSVAALDEALAGVLDGMGAEVRSLSYEPLVSDAWLARHELDRLKRALRDRATASGDTDAPPDAADIDWPEALADLAGPVTLAAEETRDPLIIDEMLDTGYLEKLGRAARQADCAFLAEYARLACDVYNLRAFLRARASGLRPERRVRLFARGGTIPADDFADAFRDDGEAQALLGRGVLDDFADARGAGGDEAALERMELACDNAVTAFVAQVKYMTFGIEPVLGYAYGVALEIANVRRVVVGKLLGVDSARIKERLRKSYV